MPRPEKLRLGEILRYGEGTISASLRDVTVLEVPEAIRDLYGYDYNIESRRIFMRPNTIQTRIFPVNYRNTLRKGTSDIRVTSASMTSSDGEQVVSTAESSKHHFLSGASTDNFAGTGQSVVEGAILRNTLGGGITAARLQHYFRDR